MSPSCLQNEFTDDVALSDRVAGEAGPRDGDLGKRVRSEERRPAELDSLAGHVAEGHRNPCPVFRSGGRNREDQGRRPVARGTTPPDLPVYLVYRAGTRNKVPFEHAQAIQNPPSCGEGLLG